MNKPNTLEQIFLGFLKLNEPGQIILTPFVYMFPQSFLFWIKILGPLLISFPFLFSIIKLDPVKPISQCFGVCFLTAGWWVFETFPLVITSFVPLVLFPLFKVSTGNSLSSVMFDDINVLILSGFFISSAFVKANLHTRISIKTVLAIGMEPNKFLFGVCAVTFIISMWISSTSTCLTMVPNVMAVLSKLEEMGNSPESTDLFSRAVLMGISISATIGGMSTVVGTAPNLIFVQIFSQTFPKAPEISFGRYFLVSFPVSIVLFIVMFFTLKMYYLRNINIKNINKKDYEKKYEDLGPMSTSEKFVGFLFVLMATLWLFRSDLIVGKFKLTGWTSLILGENGGKFIKDGTVGIMVTMFLFIINIPYYETNKSTTLQDLLQEESPVYLDSKSAPILSWELAMKETRWDVLFLISAGFMLSKGFNDSGFDIYVGKKLDIFVDWNLYLFLLLICTVIALFSNFIINTACASIFLPILASMCKNSKKLNPLLIMINACWACSYGLFLPIASPMNMIVMGTGKLEQKDFLKVGSIINIFGLIVMVLVGIPICNYFLETKEFPDWA